MKSTTNQEALPSLRAQLCIAVIAEGSRRCGGSHSLPLLHIQPPLLNYSLHQSVTAPHASCKGVCCCRDYTCVKTAVANLQFSIPCNSWWCADMKCRAKCQKTSLSTRHLSGVPQCFLCKGSKFISFVIYLYVYTLLWHLKQHATFKIFKLLLQTFIAPYLFSTHLLALFSHKPHPAQHRRGSMEVRSTEKQAQSSKSLLLLFSCSSAKTKSEHAGGCLGLLVPEYLSLFWDLENK